MFPYCLVKHLTELKNERIQITLNWSIPVAAVEIRAARVNTKKWRKSNLKITTCAACTMRAFYFDIVNVSIKYTHKKTYKKSSAKYFLPYWCEFILYKYIYIRLNAYTTRWCTVLPTNNVGSNVYFFLLLVGVKYKKFYVRWKNIVIREVQKNLLYHTRIARARDNDLVEK